MSETTHCSKCGMRFKANRLDRNGRCRSCRDVAGESDSRAKPSRSRRRAGPEPEEVTCPECFAKVSKSDHVCPKCFHSLNAEQGDDGYIEYRSAESSQVRREARKHLKRLWAVRWLVGGHMTLLWVMLVFLILLGLKHHELQVTGWKLANFFLQLALVTILYRSLNSIHVRSRGYMLLLACVYTFSAAVLYQTPLGKGAGVFALVYWSGFAAINDIYRLRALHPEAFDEGRRAGGHRAGSASSRAAGRRAKERRSGLKVLGIGAAILLVAIAGLFVVMAPPLSGPTIDGFQEAWNRNSKEDVAGYALRENQEKWVRRLERRDKKLDWNGVLPKFDGHTAESMSTGSGWVTFSGPDGSLRALFSLHEDKWILRSLDYSGFD